MVPMSMMTPSALSFAGYQGAGGLLDQGLPSGITDPGALVPGAIGDINAGGSAIPGLPGGAAGAGSGLGWNLGTANLALNGLGTIAGIFGGLKSLSLANKQFKMQRDFGNINLNNQIKSFNTALGDRARTREAVERGQAGGTNASEYVAANSLSRDASRKNVGG